MTCRTCDASKWQVVAIIIDNLQANKDAASTAVTDVHLRQFEDCWADFDPRATEFIQARMLNALLRKLDPPLGVRGMENDQVEAQIVIQTCHIPHHQSGFVHFHEVLQQLSARLAYTKLPDEGNAGKDKRKCLEQLARATPSARAVIDDKVEEVPKFTARSRDRLIWRGLHPLCCCVRAISSHSSGFYRSRVFSSGLF